MRASAGITGASEFIVVGSQSILGAVPNPPRELTLSVEADIFTLRSPHDANLIEGTIGEGSPFHSTFGYHAHGVGPETAKLPRGWQQRLVRVASPETGGAAGLCLDPTDLAVSKLIAGREKDIDFVAALFRHRLADPASARGRLAETDAPAPVLAAAGNLLRRLTGV